MPGPERSGCRQSLLPAARVPAVALPVAFIAPLLLALGLTATACSAPPTARPLAPGQQATSPAAALGARTELARGVLTYAVAFAGEHTLVTVELGTHFDLLVRDIIADGPDGPDGPGAPSRPGRGPRLRHRIRLGPADFDIGDLAIDTTRDHAWVASRDGTVRAYDLQRGALLTTWHLGSSASAVAVSPDGAYIATGTEDGILCLRRGHDGALLQCTIAHQAAITALDFHGAPPRAPSPRTALASAARDGSVVLWAVPSLAVQARRRLAGSASALAFDPGGTRLAVACSSAPARHGAGAPASHDRTPDASPHPDDAVLVWTPSTGDTIRLAGHRGPVSAVAWVPDGARLISGAWDRTIALWAPANAARIAEQRGFRGRIRDLAVSPRGARVAVGAWTDGREGPASVLLPLLYDAPGLIPGAAPGSGPPGPRD